ncbi:MAG: Cna B-type domain-containing protein [Coriobacteriales bacterium]
MLSIVLLLGILMPAGALGAAADQGDSSDTTIGETTSSTSEESASSGTDQNLLTYETTNDASESSMVDNAASSNSNDSSSSDSSTETTLNASNTYTVAETTAAAGYELNQTEQYVDVSSSGDITLLDGDTSTTTSISVTKVWYGEPYGSVTIHLFADGTDTGKELVLSSDNGWTDSFDDLSVYDSDGNEIDYSVEEDSIDGYTTAIAGYASTGFTVINTQITSVSGTISWNDSYNRDGLRPDYVTISLLVDGVVDQSVAVTAGDGGAWNFSFDGLLKYNYEDGTQISYSVSEDSVDGYTTDIVSDSSGNFSIINTHEPETTAVSVSKVWEDSGDQDGIRPDSVTVHLLADGVDTGDTLVLSSDNGWTDSFDDLYVYSGGNEITYTVSEDSVDGYTPTITGNADSGFTVTNTHEPETTSVSVTKSWDDSDDQDGIRPDSVTVQLYADGEAYGDPVELSSDNGWAYTWSDLYVYSAGEAIEYTVSETDVPDGYTSDITGDASSGFTITNTHDPETTIEGNTDNWDESLNSDDSSSDSSSSSSATDSQDSEDAASGSSDMPQTGDGFLYAPLVLIGLLSASAITVALAKRRSMKNAESDSSK